MGRKAKQDPINLTVTVEDLNGNIIQIEDLKNIVIDNKLYYEKMKIINRKLREEYGFDVV